MSELRIKAIKENLDEVLMFIDGELEKLDCSMKVQMQIDLSVEEIFINIASYAYFPDTGMAFISFESENGGSTVLISFTDTGVPYNPLEKEDPDITLTSEERQVGGLGIFLVKKNMDEVYYKYENGNNVLTMKKKIK
ncbi:MAG: ATP-binding protein [Lachnospiraceae bacterium]|nr:ATP-binding protein [Lachnospiraceae bacterium]